MHCGTFFKYKFNILLLNSACESLICTKDLILHTAKADPRVSISPQTEHIYDNACHYCCFKRCVLKCLLVIFFNIAKFTLSCVLFIPRTISSLRGR